MLDVPDPRLVLTREAVSIKPDGSIEGLTDDAKRLIGILALDSQAFDKWRLIWMRNIELAQEHDLEQFKRLMGFPDDLPNLRLLRPPMGTTDGRDSTIAIMKKTSSVGNSRIMY